MPGLEAHEEHAELLRGLRQTPKRIPVSYLYDARGSSLYEQITDLPSYYPYNEERFLLQSQAAAMVRYIPKDAVVMELGCGPATKTCILLKAVARLHSRVEFVGIDVSQQFLDEARENIDAALSALKAEDAEGNPPSNPQEVSWKVHTVCSEYLTGMRAVRRMFPDRTLVVLWLGSSVGNLEDAEARPFFKELLHVSGPQTHVLLATDLWKDPRVLQLAYDEPEGVTSAFIRNGLRHALRALGVRAKEAEGEGDSAWEYECIVCPKKKRVEMWVKCRERVVVVPGSIVIEEGERVFMEISRKFTRDDVAALAQSAGFVLFDAWSTDLYGMQLLVSAAEAVQLSWKQSDAFFQSLPDWSSTPIQYRRPFSFYYGHLAAFSALKLIQGRSEGASPLDIMYSRGIDPLLLDPSKCHAHPEAPSQWPEKERLEEYVRCTRDDVAQYLSLHLEGKNSDFSQIVGGMRFDSPMRGVLIGLEHEMMHLETLAYMKAQEDMAQWRAATCQVFNGGTHEEMGNQMKRYAHSANSADLQVKEKQIKEAPSESDKENLINGSVKAQTKHTAMLPVVECGVSGIIVSPLMKDISKALQQPRLDVVVPPGAVSLGVDASQDSAVRFVWDNEGPQVLPPRAMTKPLSVSSCPVTVGEFHAFVSQLGGYSRPELWQSADWLFLQKNDHSCPATWSLCAGEDGTQDYFVYDIHSPAADSLSGKVGEMRPWREVAGNPVLVSLAEAEAYCKAVGHGARIMTEVEWNRIAQLLPEEGLSSEQGTVNHAAGHVPSEGQDTQKPGSRGQRFCGKTVGKGGVTGGLSPQAVGALKKSIRVGGWEWTTTPFEPFPGFEAMPDYPEYSTDFFDGVHYVLKGSSPATHTALRRDSFRNFYQRQYPYVFAKFRICKEVEV